MKDTPTEMVVRLLVAIGVAIFSVSLYLTVMRRIAPQAFKPVVETSTTTLPDAAETYLSQYEHDLGTHQILTVACYSRHIIARYLGERKARVLFTDDPEAKHMCGSLTCTKEIRFTKEGGFGFSKERCKFIPIVFVDYEPTPAQNKRLSLHGRKNEN